MAVLPFFWGGRHPLGVGLAGLALLLCLLCWMCGVLFRGTLSPFPSRGLPLFLLLLGVGLVHTSPLFGNLFLPDSLIQIWAQVQAVGIAAGERVFALRPQFQRLALLTLAFSAIFYFLLTQLFSSARAFVTLALGVAGAAAFVSLAGVVQRFGGDNWLFLVYKGAEQTVSGPFFNKNHFAQLQELGFFTGLGLLMALWDVRRDSTLQKLAGRRRTALLMSLLSMVFLCLLGLVFSCSRAGILCTAAGLMLFLLYALFLRRRDAFTLPLGLLFAALILAGFYGLDVLTARLELAMSGEDPSGLVRLELWKTALSVMGLSPWLGSGFGGMGALSAHFDLGYVPGRVAFNAHNDFLELAVMVGIPCAVLILAGMFFLFCRSLRLLFVRKARRSSLHLLGVGCVCAAGVALGHEMFDYGLKQPANLLFFIAVCVVAGGGARLASTPDRTLEPSSWRLGRILWIAPALLLAPLVVLGGRYATEVRAGSGLVRLEVLRSVPQIARSMPPRTRCLAIVKQAERLLALDPDRVEALNALGGAHFELARLAETSGLAEALGRRLDRTVSAEQVWRPAYSPYITEAFSLLSDEARHGVVREYGLAAQAYRELARVLPSNGLAVSAAALSLDEASAWRREAGTALALHEGALAFYPWHCEVQLRALGGYWRAWQETADAGERERYFFRMQQLAGNVGEQAPARLNEIFPLLWTIRPDAQSLAAVTPDTLQAKERLAVFLMRHGFAAEALAALNVVEAQNSLRPDVESPETLGNIGFLRRDRRSKPLLERLVLERKIAVLTALGDENAAQQLEVRAKALLRGERTPVIERVDGLMDRGDYLLAEEALKAILDDPRALVRYAAILYNAGRLELFGRVMRRAGEALDGLDGDSRKMYERLAAQANGRD